MSFMEEEEVVLEDGDCGALLSGDFTSPFFLAIIFAFLGDGGGNLPTMIVASFRNRLVRKCELSLFAF